MCIPLRDSKFTNLYVGKFVVSCRMRVAGEESTRGCRETALTWIAKRGMFHSSRRVRCVFAGANAGNEAWKGWCESAGAFFES